MCGIAGIVDRNARSTAADNAEILRAMVATLTHRGPDDTGVWSDADAGVWLGHRRLAVIDVSPAGRQPMISADGRYVINYNGEIYNYREIAGELEGAGAAFRSHCDTEVLLEAIGHWGFAAALEKLNGMFAFALWDKRERLLHLVCDRMGEKPLYYGALGDRLLFGSELKAMYAYPGFSPSIDRNALASYLRLNCIPAPHTIYEGVQKIPPGNLLTVDPSRLPRLPDPTPYWQVPFAADRDPEVTESACIENIERLLRDSVRIRLQADVPVGVFLSGGLDSSLVTALAQAESRTRIKTYSIGFEAFGYDEAPYAKHIAGHLHTDHHEAYVSATEAQAVIPELAGIYDEPFSDSSQIPTLLISRIARNDVTVVLSGDGGDELFGGYNRHFLAGRLQGFIDKTPLFLRCGLQQGLQAISPAAWDRILRACQGILPSRYRPLPPGERLHKLADLLTCNDTAAMYRQLISHWEAPNDIVQMGREYALHTASAAHWNEARDPALQMMYLDAIGYLPSDILTKLDRASMAVSLEARLPMLDHRLVEQAMQLPLDLKIRDGQGKWILRQILGKHVPAALSERPKMGFGVPLADWLRGPLRAWADDLLAPGLLQRQGYFTPEPIRQRWAEHLSGRRNWQYHLWDVLMFQTWLVRWQK